MSARAAAQTEPGGSSVAMFGHLSALLGIGSFRQSDRPLILWQMNGVRSVYRCTGKEADFQITVAIATAICILLMLVIVVSSSDW